MKIIKACATINPIVTSPTFEMVNHAVYNDWKLAIQSLLEIRSNPAYNKIIPFKFLFQLVKLAAKIGSQQIVKMLLTFDQYLLHHALRLNSEETVEILLENGADANSWNENGFLPIHIAARVDSLKNMQLLIKFGAIVDTRCQSGWLAIHHAIYKKRTHIVRFLIENGSDVNASVDSENCYTSIHIATKVGSPDIIEILIKAGANVNSRNYYDAMPIHVAVSFGYLDCVKLMTRYGADINARGPRSWRPIHFAVFKNFIEVVQYLLQNGAEVNPKDDDGAMPIHLAAKSGYIGIMELLIDNGADVVAIGKNGWLPLHYVAFSKNVKAAQLLIDNGGNTHSTSDGGYTPIDLAIALGSESIFRFFLKNGAIVSQDSIQIAIKNHCMEIIEPLIEHGLDVNEKIGPFGNPAFHEAVECGCIRCVEALKECIKFGANTNLKDDEGKTTVEQAIAKGRINVFKFLSQNYNLK